MFNFKTIAAAAIVATAPMTVSAATYPTFELDTAASTIDVTASCLGGIGAIICGDVGLTGSFNAFSWTPTSATDQTTASDLIDWNLTGSGVKSATVEATLVFSAPSASSGSTTGSGGFGSAKIFGKVISGGGLDWNGPATINFDDGSTVVAHFHDILKFGKGSTTSSGVTFKGDTISPVPLPASALLLAGGLAGMGVMRRRRAKR